jgi:hypothetical protein
MATEKSEPQVGLIIRIGAVSIVTLLATHTALVSYFDQILRGEEHRKVGALPADALHSVRDDEKQRLTSGRTPIDRAMDMMRVGRGSNPDVMPSASAAPDVSPLIGWVKMPGEVPYPMTAPPAPPSDAPPAPSASAAPGDAGAPGATKSDAGARPAPGPKLPRKGP